VLQSPLPSVSGFRRKLCSLPCSTSQITNQQSVCDLFAQSEKIWFSQELCRLRDVRNCNCYPASFRMLFHNYFLLLRSRTAPLCCLTSLSLLVVQFSRYSLQPPLRPDRNA